MQESFTGSTSVTIRASAPEVWKALTDPALISQWLHDTRVETDWKVNSPIVYRGEWRGQPYEDKGTIIEVVEPKILRSTFLSSFSGLEDKPENYAVVSYELEEKDGTTTLKLTQSNCKSQQEADDTAKNWSTVLAKLKDLLEK